MDFLYWLKGKPKYCTKCGSALEKIDYCRDYHSKTGKPRKMRAMRCPEWSTRVVGYYVFGGGEAWEDNGHSFYAWDEKIK